LFERISLNNHPATVKALENTVLPYFFCSLSQLTVYLQPVWGISSVGRALAWHARGQRFDPAILHQRFIQCGPFFMMPFSVYIIYSARLNKYYTGYAEDVLLRLHEHNIGLSTFTSRASDWELRYTEGFPSREAAHRRELFIKRKKSRKYIEWLISSVG
jgi:putative endonuclease